MNHQTIIDNFAHQAISADNMSRQVWIVDDDSSIRWVLERALKQAGFSCVCFETAQTLMNELEHNPVKPAVILSDIRMPGLDGLALLQQIKERYPTLPVIIMTAHSDLDAAVSAYQKGAFDYIPKPFDIDEVVTLVQRAMLHNQENKTSQTSAPIASTGIIGEAPAMQEVFRIIGRLSKSSMTVLINGESGTGKELIAQALHLHSPRANAPFIALNMAAIPRDLIESELFGHEKGAFTGANQVRQGRFEQANGGTLFLDEIGDMPLDVQTRLLRVLADGQFYRIGGYSPVKVDVRIIAATHQDLDLRVKEGQFREDLFHRLNVIRILLPPLRERAEDIPRLAEYFLLRSAKELEVEPKIFSSAALEVLRRFVWPGNVRQLENICRWATVMSSSQEVLAQDLPSELHQNNITHDEKASVVITDQKPREEMQTWQALLTDWTQQALAAGQHDLLPSVITEMEKILLTSALKHTHGHKQEAAHFLGWGRNTLTRKLKELKITE